MALIQASSSGTIEDIAGSLLLQHPPASDGSYQNFKQLPADVDWVKQSFLTPFDDETGKIQLKPQDDLNRRFSSATLKYTDSSIGGNICINPPPQFTRYADVRNPGLHAQQNTWINDNKSKRTIGDVPMYVDVGMSKSGFVNYGMGNYFSEAIDDNNQNIHLRFGYATYNSLTSFLTGFYSSGMASIARAGRFQDNPIMALFRVTGNLIGLALMPIFLVPMAVMFVGAAAKRLMGIPTTKFYYIKPAMHIYWAAVTDLVNQFSTLTGLTNNIETKQSQNVLAKGDGINVNGSGKLTTVVAKFMPDEMMLPSGLIDVRAIASRSKRMEMRFNDELSRIMTSTTNQNNRYDEAIKQAFFNVRNGSVKREASKNVETSLMDWAMGWFGGSTSTSKDDSGIEQDFRASKELIDPKDPDKGFTTKAKEYAQKATEMFIAQTADGADWVTFRVDYTGSTQESFDSSTAQSGLASTINSMSSSKRELRMNLADGNIIPGMESILGAVSQVVGGAAQVLQLDGIAALAGSAFVDIPEHWDNSHARLPSNTYTMRLVSPYGNPVSMMFNIYIPLACLLAGALPLATGAQSYTSPFLCQLHDRGRNFIRLGIIDSLSISRGVSNLGFTREGQALAIDISFSVKNLSSVVSMPIRPGFSLIEPLSGLLDDDTAFSDYMMAMCGVPLTDFIYGFSSMKYRADKQINDFNSYFSASHIGSMMTGFPGVSIMNAIFKGTNAGQ